MKIVNKLFTQPLVETDVNICDAFNWLFHNSVEQKNKKSLIIC